ncbi:DUF805 domain-containing protein [Rubrivivax gelatinosus]|uniref:DUF805 domain-containing protein n=1 Tax=Rubrivivax gelatinosus TaxID=28068 RepID=A0ABS1DTM3_RUBGE|nr:DUF805 domain-containing protein [Rubrivivax gelatinosus]MBK1613288.1 DUF805 domain-containing protein [Rubrivivax gelatinosus]MBK1713346.1 DUF805 domain-containing protein [Rubrivivax gelatinosus]
MTGTRELRLLDDDDSSNPLRVFLDPRGRLSRRGFWLYGIVALGGLGLMGRALLDIARVDAEHRDAMLNALLVWPGIAVSAKRWHDRDRSAWWVAIGLIPVIGQIWMLLDNGFKRGTGGPNRFGPPPAS